MARHHFTFKDTFAFGLTKTKQHYWFCFLTFVLVALVVSISEVPLLRSIVVLLTGVSIVSISMAIARDHHFTFESLFTPLLSPMRVLKFVALSIVYSIPVIATISLLYYVPAKPAALILSIPTIYLIVRFKFFPYVVMDNENASLKDLCKASFRLTNNHFWMLFFFLTFVGIINLLGAYTRVGLLITVPVSIFASAYVYERLKAHTF